VRCVRGSVSFLVRGAGGGSVVGRAASLYRSATGILTTPGGLEARTVLAHQSVTISARPLNPPSPVASAQARMYVKGTKLVAQWNDGQQTLYTTIELDTTG